MGGISPLAKIMRGINPPRPPPPSVWNPDCVRVGHFNVWIRGVLPWGAYLYLTLNLLRLTQCSPGNYQLNHARMYATLRRASTKLTTPVHTLGCKDLWSTLPEMKVSAMVQPLSVWEWLCPKRFSSMWLARQPVLYVTWLCRIQDHTPSYVLKHNGEGAWFLGWFLGKIPLFDTNCTGHELPPYPHPIPPQPVSIPACPQGRGLQYVEDVDGAFLVVSSRL